MAAATAALVPRLVPWAKAMTLLLGGGVIGLAVATAMTGTPVEGILAWSEKIFGTLFLAVFAALLYTALLSMIRVQGRAADQPGVRAWLETGVQSASAIATLALTYTLLGISLGIGSLAGTDLNPATIPQVIRGLTEHFSMAFMTTVIGLPVSAVLRAALMIQQAKAEERAAQPAQPPIQQGD
jgi:hypothetical protein